MPLDKDKLRTLAAGPEEEIDWHSLAYDEWLYLQHLWLWGRLGVEEDSPLAITAAALDKITRQPLNGSDAYWIARMALNRIGAWPSDTE